MKLSRGKQIVYRYNGDPWSEETISDRGGLLPLSWVGETLRRNGKDWRVAVIRNDLNQMSSARAVAIHRVFLTDKL